MSNMRIGGLASGFDTNQMVMDLMKAERMPMERLLQQRQVLEWQQEGYRELNQKLFSMRDKVFDVRLESTFNSKNASSSNTSAIGVTATGIAAEGTYNLEVTQLAKGAFKTSTADLASYQIADGKTKMTLKEQFSTDLWGTLSPGEGDTGAFNINGVDFEFDISDDTIYDIVNRINAQSGETGVRANYDSGVSRFFLSTTSTGADAKIDISGTMSSTNGAILLGSHGLKLGNADNVSTGQDAVFNFNGTELTKSLNIFSLDGLNFNLMSEGSSTVTVSADIDAIVNKIKEFVDEYNSLIENINSKLAEKRYRDFHPLSKEEKEQMSDEEIELWEKKAQSGLFRGESALMNFTSSMRIAISSLVENIDTKYNSLSQIGISTSSWTGEDGKLIDAKLRDEGGKLHIDEAKLRSALSDDIEGIKRLFTNSSEDPKEAGIARSLYDQAVAVTKIITVRAGRDSTLQAIDDSFIGRRLKNINTSINSWEDRLIRIEERYWSQFTRMEQVLNKMYNQSDWMAQQFANL
ncbi:MAG: hypothetical protein APF76_02310 [Desulfitibacter sp. BRH_c19]|nr:MAG: hypothetical protein APF76_02310 [Desulfitibacter sp. BRH_c19]